MNPFEKLIRDACIYGLTKDEYEKMLVREHAIDGIRKSFLQMKRRKENVPWYDRFIISQNNPYLKAWNISISLITVFSVFTNLYITAFEANKLLNEDWSDMNVFILWLFLQEKLFGIDILVSFITEYEGISHDDHLNYVVIRSF